MRLVLYQPDIPQNTGTLMRLAACLGVAIDIIEPCGFLLDDRRLRRAGMDYLDHLEWRRWPSWRAYGEAPHDGRLLVLTTRATLRHVDAIYHEDDRLLLGRESAGIPDAVQAVADRSIRVPMAPPLRSLNVASAGAIVLGEALRQTRWTAPGPATA